MIDVTLVRPSCSQFLSHSDSGLVTGEDIKSALVALRQIATVGSSQSTPPELTSSVGDTEARDYFAAELG